MPGATQLEAIDDFVNTTLNKMEKGKWEDLAQEQQEYMGKKLLDSKKTRRIGGPYIEFPVITGRFGNARMVGVYEEDDVKIKNIHAKGKIPWRHMQGAWGYDVAEDDFQTDDETIVDMLETRDYTARAEMFELFESEVFSEPSGPTSKSLYGLLLWIQADSSSSATAGSFNGLNPSGFTSGLADIDATLAKYAGWRNYAFNYVGITKNDFVLKAKRAVRRTHWKPIVPHPQLGFGELNQEVMTTETVCEGLEDIAESRNDNLGRDVVAYMDQVLVAGRPVKNCWYLTNNYTDNPVLGVDWSAARFYVSSKNDMRRTGPIRNPRNHNGRNIFYDWKGNLVFMKRRTSFRGKQVAG